MVKAITICTTNIKKWSMNPRFYILGILLFVITYHFISPFISVSRNTGYRITPWIFPFLVDYFIVQLLLSMGFIFLFCDAPFMDAVQPYYLIRCTRGWWTLGQILYIMLSTFIYLLLVNVFIFLILTPVLYLNPEWGKVLSTLAYTDAASIFNTININGKILSAYSPLEAMALCFFLEWCNGIIIGLVLFVLNLNFSRMTGAIAASAVVLLDVLISGGLRASAYHLSPTSLARLSILDPAGLSQYPSPQYALVFLPTAVILLSVLVAFSMRKREIKIMQPV